MIVMKRISYFSFFIIFILLIIFLVNYMKIKNGYYEKVGQYCNINDGIFNQYVLSYEYFFNEYFEYPENVSELQKYIRNNQKDYINMFNNLLMDPFSKNDSSFLYIPLYSKKSKMREGFAIISAGIDGKINNIINDTMYINDIDKLRFYNKVGDPDSPPYYKPDSTFKLLNYCFGKKDLLVYYKDGVASYINNNREFTPITLYQMIIKFRQLDKQIITLTLFGIVDSVFNDHITIKENDITAYCNMYSGRDLFVKPGDTIKLACFFKGEINRGNRIIKLKNCIKIESNNSPSSE